MPRTQQIPVRLETQQLERIAQRMAEVDEKSRNAWIARALDIVLDEPPVTTQEAKRT